MPSLSVVRNSNASYTPSYVPIIVITGGTSGIGQGLAQVFANYVHGKAHIILVGRNRVAAESIIASLPKSTTTTTTTTGSESTYEFISCDVTLMKNVHALAKDLSARLPKINFLVHSAGVFGFGGRRETEEGIDEKLASRYYSRWVLTNDLLPLLRKAREAGEPASVLSVLGAGMAPEIDIDDLGLKKTYSGLKSMLQSLSYNDLMVAVSGSNFLSKLSWFIVKKNNVQGIRQERARNRIHPRLSRIRQHQHIQIQQSHPRYHLLSVQTPRLVFRNDYRGMWRIHSFRSSRC